MTIGTIAPDARQHVEPVDARQIEIEQDHGRTTRPSQLPRTI